MARLVVGTYIFKCCYGLCFTFGCFFDSNGSGKTLGGIDLGHVQNLNPHALSTPIWGNNVAPREGLHIHIARLAVGISM
jgi:hypothetical protein